MSKWLCASPHLDSQSSMQHMQSRRRLVKVQVIMIKWKSSTLITLSQPAYMISIISGQITITSK